MSWIRPSIWHMQLTMKIPQVRLFKLINWHSKSIATFFIYSCLTHKVISKESPHSTFHLRVLSASTVGSGLSRSRDDDLSRLEFITARTFIVSLWNRLRFPKVQCANKNLVLAVLFIYERRRRHVSMPYHRRKFSVTIGWRLLAGARLKSHS